MIKKTSFLLLGYLILSSVQADSIKQKTEGWCSPAVNKTEGNVVINCHGISPNIVKRLEQLLDKNESDLVKAKEDIDHWLKKYQELKNQLASRPAADKLAEKARTLLDKGDLDGAKTLLKQSLLQKLAKREQLAKKTDTRSGYR